jgi:hypothetical protein
MNVWLPIAVLVLALPVAGLFLWLVDPRRTLQLGAREALIWSAVAWAALSVISIEVLSLGTGHDPTAAPSGHYTRGWLLAIWAIPVVAGMASLAVRWRMVQRQVADVRGKWSRCSRFEQALIIVSVACVVLVGLVALIAAPNTWDSMTYHLARVAAWLRLGGIAHYATSAEPQLFQPPGAEMLIAQWQVLTGGDRMAAIVQWTAYALSIGVVSLIAARLGAARRGQLIALVLTATAPMALLEGSSTQNDLIVGLWLLIAGAMALAVWQEERLAIVRIVIACTALGLAVLTKGTALLFAPPIVILLAFVTVRRVGWGRAVGLGLAGLLIVVALNAGQWSRNHATYGKYIYTGSDSFDYSNDSKSPAVLFSNLVRNGALYFGTPSAGINKIPTDATRSALDALGINPDDPATTFKGQSFIVAKSGPDENHGGSIVLFLLTAWAVFLAFFVKRFRTTERAVWAAIVALQIVLFCAAIKWQPWHLRLHLPFVLAGIPLAAVALEQVRREWIVTTIVAVVAIAAPFYIALNVNRPLVGGDSILTNSRSVQYFIPRPTLEAQYEAVVTKARTSGASKLGVSGNFDDWYYPFSVLADGRPLVFETLVGNRSGKYAAGQKLPNVVACLHCEGDRQATLTKAGLHLVGLKVVQPPGLSSEFAITVEYWAR